VRVHDCRRVWCVWFAQADSNQPDADDLPRTDARGHDVTRRRSSWERDRGGKRAGTDSHASGKTPLKRARGARGSGDSSAVASSDDEDDEAHERSSDENTGDLRTIAEHVHQAADLVVESGMDQASAFNEACATHAEHSAEKPIERPGHCTTTTAGASAAGASAAGASAAGASVRTNDRGFMNA
jgi:hypothetical protein